MVEPTGCTATLFVREDLPGPARDRHEQIADRLSRLRDRERLDRVAVRSWSKRTRVGDDDYYQKFVSWARSEGVSLDPCFQTRTCYRPGTTERCEYRIRPAVCLVVYEECGDVDAVYPHYDGGPRTITDGLDSLGQGTRQSPAAGDTGVAD